MDQTQTNSRREEITIKNLEYQIRNNKFNSKEELVNHLVNLRNNGTVQLDNEQIQTLLNLFDSLNKKEELPLNMQKYSSVSLENQDLIVSKENQRVLQTLEGTSAFSDEFKQTQNEIIANNQDGMVNADAVFEHMATYEKEEASLISLTEAISRDNIEIEMLNKIKFFITNNNVNPHSYIVDIQKGMFYNLESGEVYEVRKNPNTNQYEVYKGEEKVYVNDMQQTYENGEETLNNENNLSKPKVRVLEKPKYPNNAAFTKIGFLIINVITFTLIAITFILLNK